MHSRGPSQAAASLVEPLTRREKEVLGLLAQGHTAPEIAARLTLALSSVKWHIQHIYAKLGAHGKRQALARAAQLGLLPGADPPPKHNLPAPLTRFFGREPELALLRARLADNRLVTLVGSGGVGKTRLALRAAEDVLGDYADGVWLVELAPLGDPALAAATVAATLGLRDQPGQPILESLTRHLRPRQALLLLDNCEHLLEACAHLAESLLRACPRLKLLVTSREPLSISGEALLRVAPLDFPAAGVAEPAERLAAYAAVQLFVDRAQSKMPGYAVTAVNAQAVARICRRLDGIALALEMAAARINLMSAEQMADRLDDAFRLLASGSSTALPRQQTMRATLDWSYQALIPPQRLLFQRLSVFAGGFTLEAAEAVCADAALEHAGLAERLAELVSKSMVVAQRQPSQAPRFTLLEVVAQYAAEKLHEAGASADLRSRHFAYYRAYVEANNRVWDPSEDARGSLPRIWLEFENIRRALAWAFTGAAGGEAGLRLAILLYDCWPSTEEGRVAAALGLEWCRSQPGISLDLYANALGMAAVYTAMNDPQAAMKLVLESVEVSRGLRPQENMLHLEELRHAGWFSLWVVHDVEQARSYYAQAEAYFDAHGRQHMPPAKYEFYRAWLMTGRANLHLADGDYRAAKQTARESMRLFEACGGEYDFGYIDARNYYGAACIYLGEYDDARASFQAAIAASQRGGMQNGGSRHALSLRWIGFAYLHQGEHQSAIAPCLESIRLCQEMADYNITASCLGVLALAAAGLGQHTRAARLAGASAAMWARQKRTPWEDSSMDTLLPGWHDGQQAAALQQAYDAGHAMNNEQAVAYGPGDSAA